MGIFGLLGHCLAHRDECVEYFDLVTVATLQNSRIELLCDFYSFEYLICKAFWDSLSKVTGNNSIRLFGGEYQSLHDYVSKFIHNLRSVGIDLVMFVDSARGSTGTSDWQRKFDTWRQRFNEDMKRCWAVVDCFTGRKKIDEVVGTQTIRPVLLDVQMLETLTSCSCQIVQCTEGEADVALVNALHHRPRAFAILSNDSDFCVFNNCRFIPHDLFDLNNNLKLGASEPLPSLPTQLSVGVISSIKVAKLFGFTCQEDLVELSIIAGNDFTRQYTRNLQRHLNLVIRGTSILQAGSDLIRRIKKVENSPVVMDDMRRDAEFAEALRYSREFYSAESTSCVHYTPLGTCLRDGVESCKLSIHVMGMYQLFYWQRVVVEDLRWHGPSIESCLAPLRAFVYKMVLDGDKSVVTECTRSAAGLLETTQVRAATDRFVPPANFIQRSETAKNVSVFLQIMSHQERDKDIDWFQKYGFRNGFYCCVVRYLVVLMSRVGFELTVDEFLALMVSGLAKIDVSWYQGLGIVPSIRCITIGSWFQDVYRHAFVFVGKLLCLDDKFPNPKDCFSASVFATFYAHSTRQIGTSLTPDVLQKIKFDFDAAVNEKTDMIRTVDFRC